MEPEDRLLSDRGLLYAEACFETFRVIGGGIFGWQEHESRLRRGLACFGIDLPEGLLSLCLDAAAKCGPDVLLRITVSGGQAPWGLRRPNRRGHGIHIMTRHYEGSAVPVSLRTIQWPFSLRARPAKFTADYAETLRALEIVRDQLGDDEDALVCNDRSMVSAMTANVLIHRKHHWWTPAGNGVLPGIIRSALLQSGIVTESDCPIGWFEDCQVMAVCNSGSFITPIRQINGRELPVTDPAINRLWQPLIGRPGVPV